MEHNQGTIRKSVKRAFTDALVITLTAVTVGSLSLVSFYAGKENGTELAQAKFCRILSYQYPGEAEQDFINFGHCPGEAVPEPDFASYSMR